MTKRVRGILLAVIAAGLIVAIAFSLRMPGTQKAANEKDGAPSVETAAIQTSYGWGYEVRINNKTYIHQEYIPALPGKQGFSSKEEALLVGRKVAEKIRQGILPPTISIQELRQMGVAAAQKTSSQ